MSVGRQWVRRLGLLLAAGLVVQMPALVGVGVRGASAAHPTPTPTASSSPTPNSTPTPTPTPKQTPSYSVNLSINSSTCVATVTASWSGVNVRTIELTVTDLNYTSAPADAWVSVSGRSGTASHSFPLNKKPIGTAPFNAQASFTSAQGQIYGATPSSSVDAPCYLGTLGAA